jgi:hypothetical protein
MKLVKKGKRLQSVPEGASLTDQSDKNYLDINNIMKHYAKTGVLPQFKEKIAQYLDVSSLPSYMEAHEQIQAAKELFYKLPSDVRRLADNNPAKLEQVINNPDYSDLLYKHGLIEKKAQPVEQSDGQASQVEDPASPEPL